MMTPQRLLSRVKTRRAERKKPEALDKYIKLYGMRLGTTLQECHIERLLLERAAPEQVESLLSGMQLTLREEIFIRNSQYAEEEKSAFVSLTGKKLLEDSAKGFMAPNTRLASRKKCLRHILWAAEHSMQRKLKAAALTHLTFIAQNLNHGICPEGCTRLEMDEPLDEIKKAMFRIFDNEFFQKSTYSKSLANTPPGQPVFQRMARGLSQLTALAGLAGMLFIRDDAFLILIFAGACGDVVASGALGSVRTVEEALLSLEFRAELRRMERQQTLPF